MKLLFLDMTLVPATALGLGIALTLLWPSRDKGQRIY
ncbi:hypothetical protein BH09MYX1_BH09MYX1_44750 [soil metagenome]